MSHMTFLDLALLLLPILFAPFDVAIASSDEKATWMTRRASWKGSSGSSWSVNFPDDYAKDCDWDDMIRPNFEALKSFDSVKVFNCENSPTFRELAESLSGKLGKDTPRNSIPDSPSVLDTLSASVASRPQNILPPSESENHHANGLPDFEFTMPYTSTMDDLDPPSTQQIDLSELSTQLDNLIGAMPNADRRTETLPINVPPPRSKRPQRNTVDPTVVEPNKGESMDEEAKSVSRLTETLTFTKGSGLCYNYMASYNSLVPVNIAEQPKRDSKLQMHLDEKTILFFEPRKKLRSLLGLNVIRAVGPIIITDHACNVIPLWLCTDKVVFFYRFNSSKWLLALQYGSTENRHPFTDEVKHLTGNSNYYDNEYANSLLLESASYELHALTIAKFIPATCKINSWKQIFSFYRLKPTANSYPEICLNAEPRLLSNFNILKTKDGLEDGIFVPTRPESSSAVSSMLMSSYNGLQRVLKHVTSTDSSIVKAGSQPSNFPGVILPSLTDFVNYALLVPHSESIDAVSTRIEVFHDIFGEYLERLVNPLDWTADRQYTILVGEVKPEDVIGEIVDLPEYAICPYVRVSDWRLAGSQTGSGAVRDHEYFGIARHPLVDIIAPLQYASMLLVDGAQRNPVAASMLIARAAHRISCLVARNRKRPTWITKCAADCAEPYRMVVEALEKRVQVLLRCHEPLESYHFFNAFVYACVSKAI